MRAPAEIKNWLTPQAMDQWVQDAPDSAARNRRMAIWLTCRDRLHAHEVARRLDVSTQAVWLWIHQYNEKGPDGLLRKGRGGRHWGFMTTDEEIELLNPFLQMARSGQITKPNVIKAVVEKHLQKSVSMSYIYRLLRRHGWAEILAQSHANKVQERSHVDFETLANPWQ